MLREVDPERSEREPGELRRVRVFLAEDDPALRRLLALVLRAEGYQVIEAEDGPSLLDQLGTTLLEDTTLAPPDGELILTDVQMPGISGLDVLVGLRQAQWRTPIIVMTAFGDQAMRRRARRMGVSAFLSKPIDLAELRAVVARVAPPPGPRRRQTT